jgi:Putative redox-active protein (C_GCAxxG_C_C)/FlgD Ig-like domain
MKITRKEFLYTGTKYAAGAVAGIGAVSILARSKGIAGAQTAWPYPYQALDVETVRKYGHDLYYSKGCCYGSFHALVKAASELIGEPWTSFPSEIMVYGKGGGVGWGILCGAANGPAAFISLVCPTTARADVLVNELFGWYTQTSLPTDMSNQYARESAYGTNPYPQDLSQNISGSVLCHVSVTEWCKAAGKLASSTERKDRCARVTGDLAAYAAKILNDEFAGSFAGLYVPPATVAGCNSCHTIGTNNMVAAKMECTQCHGDPHTSNGVADMGGVVSDYSLHQNYPNPFNPQTRVEFSLPKAGAVDLAVYDVHGRLIRNLVLHEEFSPGRYGAEWDGTNNAGEKVATGVYFCRLQAGQFSATKKMLMMK